VSLMIKMPTGGTVLRAFSCVERSLLAVTRAKTQKDWSLRVERFINFTKHRPFCGWTITTRRRSPHLLLALELVPIHTKEKQSPQCSLLLLLATTKPPQTQLSTFLL
jgi:hypothetical protein